jgi:hypothetical protein
MVLVQRFEEVEDSNIRFILMAKESSTIVGPLRSNLLSLSMKCLSIDHWLDRLLTVCVAEQVGYDREGIKLVVELASNDFGAAIDLIQQCFIHKYFISADNVIKTVTKILAEIQARKDAEKTEKRNRQTSSSIIPASVGPSKASSSSSSKQLTIEPRQQFDASRIVPKPKQLYEVCSLGKSLRCNICTLPPPCKHISGKLLISLARERIASATPHPDMPLCPSYVKTGACEYLTLYGYCRLHHPPELFTYIQPPKRCPVCTIPEPCNTCQWFIIRRAVARLVSRASTEFLAVKAKGSRATLSLAKYTLTYIHSYIYIHIYIYICVCT